MGLRPTAFLLSKERARRVATTAGAAVLGLAPFLPLAGGLPRAHDLPDHTAMAAEFARGLREGRLYPRWFGDFNLGWGEPTGVFYPPGLPATAAVLHCVTGWDVPACLYAVLAGFSVAGTIGVLRYASRLGGARAGVLAAAFWALLPFRVFELYGAGLLSAYAAGSLLPYLLAQLRRLAGGPEDRRNAVLLFALLYAAIVLINLPSALLAGYLTAGWALLASARNRSIAPVASAAAAGSLGACLAAAYLVPALGELRWIVEPHSDGEPLWRSNFVFQLSGSWMGPGLWNLFSRMALVPFAALGAGGVLFLLSRRNAAAGAWRGLLGPPLAAGLFGAFLALGISAPLWAALPLLAHVNMPWRLLDSISAPAAWCLGFLAREGTNGAFSGPRAVRILTTCMLFGGALFVSAPLPSLNGRLDREETGNLARLYFLRQGYFLPRGAARPLDLAAHPPLRILVPGTQAAIEEWGMERRVVSIESREGAPVVFRTYAYPGWRIEAVTGTWRGEFELSRDEETGALRLDVPPGSGRVILAFGATPLRRAALGLSLAACLFWLWAACRLRRTSRAT